MSDVIQLLSDHLANQIAAGEVIQRPASAVKELLENAIDAGATDLQLIIKDAGKELIQVIDNGCGMSVTDARMSFERHATSKIKNINDLFTIRTMGFRGEALASIAAVAQVEMKTRQATSDIGTRLVIEGTEVKLQEPCGTPIGTSIAVKNLFFNVPARRNFLKSNTTEYRHIIDEFIRIALAYPQIGFRVWHNGQEQFHLEIGNLKTRIVALLGNSHEKNLVPIEEQTELLHIKGFVGKPEAATRTRGMQFFFVNNRFIRNNYLHHALVAGYEGLLEKEHFPFYVLFLETDPKRVDVNVHPTKQEVKFEDDRLMYTYLNAAVKHSLARYNIAPSLDFTLNPEITQLSSVNIPQTQQQRSDTEKGYLFNTFSQRNQAHVVEHQQSRSDWKKLYESAQQIAPSNLPLSPSQETLYQATTPAPISHDAKAILLQEPYLVSTVKSGFLYVHCQRAQERIWYERLSTEREEGVVTSQRLLYPIQLSLGASDAVLLHQIIEELQRHGFDIEPFGKQDFIIHATPAVLQTDEVQSAVEEVLEDLKNDANATDKYAEKIINKLAKKLATTTQALRIQETRQALIDELFACAQPEYTPDGKKIFTIIRPEDVRKLLDA